MMPQFKKSWVYRLRVNHLTVGITIFCLGLFKKVVFADTLAGYATPVFNAANLGVELSFFEAWVGALAYTFQLYFDFSGYSDMALGIARMFGILLPLNFYSPYKSRNIIEFWRRWHMTLSRFLRDYVYIAMGGNRKGNVRRYINLLTTMLVGGLWHGAGWTFVIWGGLHGFYLIVNHFWQHFTPFLNSYRENNNIFYSFFSWSLTFLAVIFAWVLFRAESLAAAKQVLSAMIGLNGLSVPESLQVLPTTIFKHEGFFPNDLIASGLGGSIKYILVFGVIALVAPNTVQIMQRYLRDKSLYQIINVDSWLKVFQWRPTRVHAVFLLAIVFYALHAMLGTASEFLYFQF